MIMSMDTPTGSSISSNTWKNRILANFRPQIMIIYQEQKQNSFNTHLSYTKVKFKVHLFIGWYCLLSILSAQLRIFFWFSFRYIFTGYNSSKILHDTKIVDEKYWTQIVTSRQTHFLPTSKMKLFDMFMYKALYFDWFEKIYLFLLGKCEDLFLEDIINTPSY